MTSQGYTCSADDLEIKTNIAMFLVTPPIVINVPTRGLLDAESMRAIVQWLANLNIKRNVTSMFVNKKHRYRYYSFLSVYKSTLYFEDKFISRKETMNLS